jgi:hypothetical protein
MWFPSPPSPPSLGVLTKSQLQTLSTPSSWPYIVGFQVPPRPPPWRYHSSEERRCDEVRAQLADRSWHHQLQFDEINKFCDQLVVSCRSNRARSSRRACCRCAKDSSTRECSPSHNCRHCQRRHRGRHQCTHPPPVIYVPQCARISSTSSM